MDIGLTLVSVVIFLLLVFALIGCPMLLTDWLQNRRQAVIRRQIALTDAIDGRFGAVVAPVVKRPLWGPWQIQIAVPFTRPGAVGRILAVAHEVLSVADCMNPGRYEIVLTPKQARICEGRESRADKFAERGPGYPIVAGLTGPSSAT